MSITPVRYSPSVEEVRDDERETFDRIARVMSKGADITRERYGREVRTSHAKAHGLVRGELRVLDGLPLELAQGLFAVARSYEAIVRLAHVPGEYLDDRKVSTPRGMAIKLMGVEGEMLPGHTTERTQDFVLDTGKTFISRNATSFLAAITMTETSTPMPDGVKAAVSAMSQATNAALQAIGVFSANVDFFGHPKLHPLAESYFSQLPFRYGDYIAKLGVFPDLTELKAIADELLDLGDEDALRIAVTGWFRHRPAEYVVAVQLCTDLDRMPVENSGEAWDEEESPFQPVARLVLPPQDAFDADAPAREDELSFSPAHSLAAHRPLGSVNRARMHVYEIMAERRRRGNGRGASEPTSMAA